MSDPWERSRLITSCAFLLVTCSLLCGIAGAAPSIALSRKSGPPTSKILVSGRGFKPNVGVDIYFGTRDEALVVTNSSGEFDNAKIHAPRSAHPGEHWVTALERNNDKGAQEPFLVRTDWNQFHLNGTHVGYNAYENVLNRKTARDLQLEWTSSDTSSAESSPAIADGVAYFTSGDGSGDGVLRAVNANTGETLWNCVVPDAFFQGSTAVDDGIVYLANDTGDYDLYAVEISSRTVLWKFHPETSIYASPMVASGIVYVGDGDGNIYALHGRTGALLWTRYDPSFYIISAPAAANGVLYSPDGASLDAFNAQTGTPLWSYAMETWYSPPAVADGVVYIGSYSGDLVALSASTGTLLWTYTTGDKIASSPAVANGTVYVGSMDDSLYAINATTGVLRWKYTTPTWITGSPAVANDVVYFGGQDRSVYALDARTGAFLWSYETGNEIGSGPAVADGMVYIISFDYNVYAFSLKHGQSAKGTTWTKPPDPKTLRPDFTLVVNKAITLIENYW
jgi:outer membrane protein assembly factor BamB